MQLQKWGLKFDGSSKSVSIEEFVFRAEALRSDYNCPWDILVKGFHHLLAGRAYAAKSDMSMGSFQVPSDEEV